jgi:hypothetical protein
VQVVECTREALAAAAPTVAALARAEDLPAHARAVAVRLEPAAGWGTDRLPHVSSQGAAQMGGR